MRNTQLTEVPVWVGELTRLEALEISGVDLDEGNTLLESLPASLGQPGALYQLTLACLGGRGTRVFIINVQGTFFGMSESEETSKS